MQNPLLLGGIACLIAAIIGGGLKAFGIELPLITSKPRQIALGVLGFILVAGITIFENKETLKESLNFDQSSQPTPTTDYVALTNELKSLYADSAELRTYSDNLAKKADARVPVINALQDLWDALRVKDAALAEQTKTVLDRLENDYLQTRILIDKAKQQLEMNKKRIAFLQDIMAKKP